MIFGIGVDVTRISRFASRSLDSHFCCRVCAPQEREWLAQRGEKRRAEGLAGCWAAKEAFLKAAGTGLSGFELGQIQVTHSDRGAPQLHLGGEAARWAAENHLKAHLSISHDADLCTAFVVLEVQEKGADSYDRPEA